jgi:hypothetical protein
LQQNDQEKTMQNKTRLALAAGVAAIVGLGIAGAAQADRGGYHGHGAGMRGGPQMAFLMQFTERYDANKDGKISQEEIDNNRSEWLTRFDTDKDGTLSLKEFEALWLEARRREMVREFQRFDKDGDAKVTVDEYKEPLARVVENRDRNGDGFLSKDDRRMGHKRRHQGRTGAPDGSEGAPETQQQ